MFRFITSAAVRPRSFQTRVPDRQTIIRIKPIAFASAAMACLAIATRANAEDIQTFPRQFELNGPAAVQTLSTLRVDDLRDDDHGNDDTKGSDAAAAARIGGGVPVEYQSSDPGIVTVRDGIAVPVGDGDAIITATDAAGRTAQTRVRVVNAENAHVPSFRNEVQSVLAKRGCNMGACHGALAGKGGFRLSLRGYDVDADYHAITRDARGRRVELSDPGRSLLIAKPSGALPHKGGLRLDSDSDDYQTLARWITAGAPRPAETDAKLESISVIPAEAHLKPGDRLRVLVNAHYDDDTVVDVTRWAQFTATDEAVAGVDDDGVVDVRNPGSGAVSVWFGSKIAVARMTVPYDNAIDPAFYRDAPQTNFIDRLNLQRLQTLNLKPSPRCDDETFLRRVCLDTVGRLPTEDERRLFRSGDPETRRGELIDRLLASDDYADYWAYRLSDVLLINGNLLRPAAVQSYYRWLHAAIRRNQAWDDLVTELLTSTGNSIDNGATNFFAVNQTPEDMTENACQAFMGLSIGCAKCHNHPLEKWTNDQYYAMANLFARVRAKGWGGDGRNGDGRRDLYVAPEGELIQPGTGRPQPPAPLDADPIPPDDPRDRREVLADWMTSPENPYFARSIVNRVWANYFGRGLVEQVDDLRLSNPASDERLLAALSDHLIDAQFDLKILMRTILNSETYGRSSVPIPENVDENKFNSRYYPRRMMAEVLLDAIDDVLGTSSSFTRVAFPGADFQNTEFYGNGTRAIELYDSAVDSYFLKTFGRNPREITCECERDDEPSMVQVLHLSNGDTLNPKLASDHSVTSRAIQNDADNQTVIERLFRRALCRTPTDGERETLSELMDQYGDDRQAAIRDVAWSVLTSTEFTFNH